MTMTCELYKEKKERLIYDKMDADELRDMLERYIDYSDMLIDTINDYKERCYSLEQALRMLGKTHCAEEGCNYHKRVTNKDWHKLFEKYGVKEED